MLMSQVTFYGYSNEIIKDCHLVQLWVLQFSGLYDSMTPTPVATNEEEHAVSAVFAGPQSSSGLLMLLATAERLLRMGPTRSSA